MADERRKGPFRTYVAALAVLAGVVAFEAVAHFSHGTHWKGLIGFGILAFVAAQFPLALSNGALYDIGFVITIAALVAYGPGIAALATTCAFFSVKGGLKHPLSTHIFNASQLTVSAAVAGIAYKAMHGLIGSALVTFDPKRSGAWLLLHLFLPLVVATAINFLINTSLVSGAIAILRHESFRGIWRGNYGYIVGTYTAFALLGLLMGVLKVMLGWSSVLLILMPLLVARHAFQAAVTMQGAYDETVKGLVKAIEAKDPYTRGHAQRVSILAERTARQYGLAEDKCRVIRYAALMHDIGKLGVWSQVLKKAGKLTPDEYEHMKIHPVRGVEIIQEIDLLQEAIDGVRHHHERMDGKGYPDGLVGDQIPLFARLIMVADAFDSMTSTRVYRVAKTVEEAVAELRRCAGTQFDIPALDALEKAIAQHGWEPVGREELPEEIEQPATIPVEMGMEQGFDPRAASL